MFNKNFLTIITASLILLFINSNTAFAQTEASALTVTPTPTPIIPKEEPQTGINLTVSPIYLSLNTKPGETVSSQIKVKNNNNFEEYLEINLNKYVPSGEGRPVLAELTEGEEFKDWISFSDQQFILGPNQTKTIKFTIDTPETAALGYYYALVVSRIKEKGAEGGSTVVSGAPAVSLLLEVESPNAIREVQMLDFKTSRFIYEYLPVEFEVLTKNTGNIHVVPFGDIFIDWGKKEDIANLNLNPSRGNILPETERVFKPMWKDGFIVRNQKENKLDWDLRLNKFRIGKYTAHLLMVYNNGERDIPVESRASFWVIPYKIIGAISIILMLALFGFKNIVISAIKSLTLKLKRTND